MRARPQFSLRSLFVLKAVVAVGLVAWKPIWRRLRPVYVVNEGRWTWDGHKVQRINRLSDGSDVSEWLERDDRGELQFRSRTDAPIGAGLE
jgi:hypothetical protein